MSVIGASIFRNPEPWTERARCAESGPDDATFYPDKWGRSTDAKMICRTCPVIQDCFEYAMTHNERYGIWAGLNTKEREEIRRQARGKRASNHKPGCGCVICRRSA